MDVAFSNLQLPCLSTSRLAHAHRVSPPHTSCLSCTAASASQCALRTGARMRRYALHLIRWHSGHRQERARHPGYEPAAGSGACCQRAHVLLFNVHASASAVYIISLYNHARQWLHVRFPCCIHSIMHVARDAAIPRHIHVGRRRAQHQWRRGTGRSGEYATRTPRGLLRSGSISPASALHIRVW